MEQKKNKDGVIKRIFWVALILVFIVYLLYNTFRLVTHPSDAFVVDYGKLNMKETCIAYLIRDEKVLQGENYQNGMEKEITEGKRVAKGESVFRYYATGNEQIRNEIAELDKQIVDAQKTETAIYNTDIEVLKNKIKELEEKIYLTNNVEEIKNYKKEIDDNSYKIASIVSSQSPDGSILKELINKRNGLLSELTSGAEEIKAEESGTVSYRIDNMEDKFTTGDFSYLTKEFLDEQNLRTGEIIETNNEKGKIITEFKCYLAAEMNSDASKNTKVGDNVKIELDPSLVVKGKTVQINDAGDSRILIFEVNDLPEKLIDYRKLSVNIIWWEEEGLKVPNSAITEENGKHYVVRNRAGFNVKLLVKVLKQNDSYSIVSNYSTKELQDMGYSLEEIQNMYNIKQYDKIEVKSK